MSKKYAIVVARYKEDIRWMSYLGRRPEWDVIVYNDGPDLDPYYTPNFTIHKGDRVPAEASKYLQFICDYFDTMHKYEWIVFTQADPFEHSPDFVGLLESTENWQAPFQGLTNGPFPAFFSQHRIYPTSSIGGFRVWNDCLNNQNWSGRECNERPNPVRGAGPVSEFFEFFGAKLGAMKLWFCACFATTPLAIHEQTYETWKRLHEASKRNFEVIDEPRVWDGWVHTPNEFKMTVSEKRQNKKFRRRVNIGKAFAYLMELAWHPLLVHEALHEEPSSNNLCKTLNNSRSKVVVLGIDNRPDLNYRLKSQAVNHKMCSLVEYEYVFWTMDETNFTNFHPATRKIHMINLFLEKSDCDILVFLDSDAWIQNPFSLNKIIDRLRQSKKHGCFSRDPYEYNIYYLTHNTYINSGSFIIKNNSFIKEMYKTLIQSVEMNEKYQRTWPFDQYYISKFVFENKDNFLVFEPDVLNTPDGRVLRHNWYKNNKMWIDLNEILQLNYIDEDNTFEINKCLNTHQGECREMQPEHN